MTCGYLAERVAGRACVTAQGYSLATLHLAASEHGGVHAEHCM